MVVSMQNTFVRKRETLTKSRCNLKRHSPNNFLASELGFNRITLTGGHPGWN